MSKKQRIGLEAILDLGPFDKGSKAYEAGITRLGQKTDTFAAQSGKNIGLMSGPLQNIAGLAAGAVAGGFVTAGIAAATFFGSSLTASKDFEKQLSNVTAVLNGTAEDTAKLRDLALGLGLDTKLTVSSSEAADVMGILAQNGLTAEQILAGAARSTILLANATGTNFGNAADIASTTATIFGIEAGNMESAVNGITAVTNSSRFTIDDYALALANGGAVANSLGVEFDDFNTVIAGTASSFTSGQTAGTAFRTFITRLNPATDKAAALMSDLGLSFYDAKGNLKGMPQIVGELNKAFSGMSEMELSEATRTIFGEDGKSMAIALSKMDPASFIALQSAMAKTSAADNAAIRVDNLAGAVDILMGAVEGAQLAVGSLALPFLKDAALQAAGVVSTATQIFTGFAQAVLSSGDPVGFITGKLLEVFPALAPLRDGVLNIANAFGQSMPMIKTYAGDAIGFVQGLFGMAFPQISQNVGQALTTIAGWWTQHGGTIMAIVNGAFRFITATISGALTLASGLITMFLQISQGDWDGAFLTMKNTLTSFGNQALSIIGTDLNKMSQAWEGTFKLWNIILDQGFKNVAAWLLNGINSAIQAAMDLVNFAFAPIGQAIIDGMVQGVVQAAVALATAVGNAVLAAVGAGEEAGDIHSPSGLTRKRLGQPLGMGAVAGVMDTAAAMSKAMGALVINGVQGSAGRIASPAGSSYTFAPTYQYQPTYASAPKAPSQDFAMMAVLAG